MIKAIIFDCFGVLTTEAWLSFKTKYFGRDAALFEQASSISWQADRGEITYDDFMKTIAGLAGITPAEAIRAIARNVPDEQLFTYIGELKADYKVGLLSNVAGDYLHNIFSKDQLAVFDAIALSFESGFIKPEKQAFEIIVKQLDVAMAECVFIDDQARNVQGAVRAGLEALLYRDVATLRQELGQLLQT
jgi:HAD superfamily hydrolase (TIGR01509 family)